MPIVEYKEELHPRDIHGRWRYKGGGKTPATEHFGNIRYKQINFLPVAVGELKGIHDRSLKAPLTGAEERAVKSWTVEPVLHDNRGGFISGLLGPSPDYSRINFQLRKGHGPEWLEAEAKAAVARHASGKKDRVLASTIRNLDTAIDKSSLSEDIETYRGISKAGWDILVKAGEGRTYTDKGYVSTAFDGDAIGERFTGSEGQQGGIIKVWVPKGSSALLVVHEESPASMGLGEDTQKITWGELLIARGSKFRIVELNEDVRTATVMLLDQEEVRQMKMSAEEDWKKPEYDFEENPNFLGKKSKRMGAVYFHDTKASLIPQIMKEGLKVGEGDLSRGSVWANDKVTFMETEPGFYTKDDAIVVFAGMGPPKARSEQGVEFDSIPPQNIVGVLRPKDVDKRKKELTAEDHIQLPETPEQWKAVQSGLRQRAKELASKAGFKGKITVREIKRWGGLSADTFGEFYPETNEVVLYTRPIVGHLGSKVAAEGVVVHEMQHAKFNQVVQDPKNVEAINKYLYLLHEMNDEARGVSLYAGHFWTMLFEKNVAKPGQVKLSMGTSVAERMVKCAIDETLAEIAAKRQQGETDNISPRLNELFDAVDEMYRRSST